MYPCERKQENNAIQNSLKIPRNKPKKVKDPCMKITEYAERN